jgi:hypothetical protein
MCGFMQKQWEICLLEHKPQLNKNTRIFSSCSIHHHFHNAALNLQLIFIELLSASPSLLIEKLPAISKDNFRSWLILHWAHCLEKSTFVIFSLFSYLPYIMPRISEILFLDVVLFVNKKWVCFYVDM